MRGCLPRSQNRLLLYRWRWARWRATCVHTSESGSAGHTFVSSHGSGTGFSVALYFLRVWPFAEWSGVHALTSQFSHIEGFVQIIAPSPSRFFYRFILFFVLLIRVRMDRHQFGKPDPVRIRVKSRIRLCIKVKRRSGCVQNSKFITCRDLRFFAVESRGEPWTLTMRPRVL